ncbi:RhuM family protein [Aggregatimonas sangjinii]|uniref:RhuM family protein n=1 Tax=Aggregatimonas sangjinii TaxID=2583587 RepID=UPI001F297446|nr:RhuM family protein [Aggregatimonas sangjinii]
MTIEQMADLFKKAKSTINEHILNIYKEGELPKEESLRKIGISDFSTKPTNFYNLDTIISVGYRVKSKEGVLFRRWANQVIKEYLIRGYSINQKRLKQIEKEVKFLRSGIQIVSRAIEEKANEEGFEYLNQFAKGFSLLDDYDHENLDKRD